MMPDITDGRNIVWIASYPKSGSTWLRCLLTAIMFPEDPLDINRLIGGSYQLDRQALDDHSAIESANMSFDELIPYRADFHRSLAEQADGMLFLKTHNRYLGPDDNGVLFPGEISRGAIYVVRDPVDIIPSLAHHEGRDFAWTVDRLNDCGATLNRWPDKTSPSLPEWMDNWSGHVASWLDQTAIPICLVRYEDLHQNAHETFAKVLAFCGIATSAAQIDTAIQACALSRLKEKEISSPFREAVTSTRPFFRSGTIGEGHRKISSAALESILYNHIGQMERLGYGQRSLATSARQ